MNKVEPRAMPSEPMSFYALKSTLLDRVSYDNGLNRRVGYRPAGESKPLEEGPVRALNRSSMIANFLESIDENPDTKAAFVMMDLSDMHFADKAGAGDYVLNKFAKALLEALVKFKLGNITSIRNTSVDLCRYGGDEFCISLIGDFDRSALEKLKTEISSRFQLADLAGYFKKGLSPDDPVERKPIKLKQKDNGDVVEISERPESGEEREIFDQFMRRGQLLSEEQIKMVMKLPNLQDFISTPISPAYSSDSISDGSKLRYMANRFPVIAPYVDIIRGSYYNDVQRAELRKSLENRLFDKLFANIVYTPSEFVARLPQYRDVYCFDLKFVREMNDIVSYPEADMAIISLYGLLKDRLGDGLMDRVEIGRRGGTFYVGVKSNLLNNTRYAHRINKALSDIHTIPVNIRGSYVNLELGVSFMSNAHERNKLFGEQDFGALNEEAEMTFLKKQVKHLAEERRDGGTNLEHIFGKGNFKNQGESLDYHDWLLQEFLLSKRALLRTNKIHKLVWSGEEFQGTEFNLLRKVMSEIYGYSLESQTLAKPIDQAKLFDRVSKILG